MATNPFRFGSASAGYIDLPGLQGGAQVTYDEMGGSARSISGVYLKDRTGAPKRKWAITFRPWEFAQYWQPFQAMFLASPGPYELYDGTVPNLLPTDDSLGIGWVTATGTPVAAQSSTRLALSGAVASAQTAITTTPPAASMIPTVPGQQYTAAISVDGQVAFSGTFSVYGYTSALTGSGTIQLPGVALAANGRYPLTFTAGAGIVWVELRATRTAGSANVYDPSLWYGPADSGRNVRSVVIEAPQEDHFTVVGNRASITASLVEI